MRTKNKRAKPKNKRAKRSIRDVKEQHEQRLLRIPGVEGVGIGASATGGQPVIKLYVSSLPRGQRQRIPKRLGSYPVEVEMTGKFDALSVDDGDH